MVLGSSPVPPTFVNCQDMQKLQS